MSAEIPDNLRYTPLTPESLGMAEFVHGGFWVLMFPPDQLDHNLTTRRPLVDYTSDPESPLSGIKLLIELEQQSGGLHIVSKLSLPGRYRTLFGGSTTDDTCKVICAGLNEHHDDSFYSLLDAQGLAKNQSSDTIQTTLVDEEDHSDLVCTSLLDSSNPEISYEKIKTIVMGMTRILDDIAYKEGDLGLGEKAIFVGKSTQMTWGDGPATYL